MDPLSIRQILNNVRQGIIRVPTFQRGFVWDNERVAFLMDSIYKGYPIGSVLIWRTKERLVTERNLGPFTLPEPDADYPIDYILDGQQRITSVFGVFQNELTKNAGSDDSWTNIYFDFEASNDAQESQFVALTVNEAIEGRHFPLKSLFDTKGYRDATENLEDTLKAKADSIQEAFKEARIPVQTLNTDNRTTVAIVFERVNQRGVDLDTLQLLTAWTWSGDFDLQSQFKNLSSELDSFGFKEVGEDQNLMLRCASGVIADNATIETLISLNGAAVRSKFPQVSNGLKGAVDFLRNEVHAASLSNLPYANLLIPLAVFFATEDNKQLKMSQDQKELILKWFWRVCFSRRYNSQPIKSIQVDINEILALKEGRTSKLGEFAISKIQAETFWKEMFRTNNVITKTFVLLLAQKNPLSFVSGRRVSLQAVLKDYNRNEFHHLYPRSYLKDLKPSYDVNCLANFCFLSRVDNNTLGGVSPAIYKSRMPQNVEGILQSSFCPKSLFNDNFDQFVEERSEILAKEANALMGF